MKRLPLKGLAWLVALVATCLLAAACGGGSKAKSTGTSTGASTGASTTSSAPSGGAVGGKLVIDNESGSTWTCQFNPFNASLLGPGITFGYIYEPLEYVNILQSTKPPVPMLASSSTWSNGYKTLTFTIRSGVKWTDGTPFTAKDVLYTFNAIKTDSAADLNALWNNAGGPLTARRGQGRQPGRLHLQRAGPDVLLLRRRPDPDRARSTSGPSSTRPSSPPTPTPARRHRAVQGLQLLAAEHQVPAQLRATGRASPAIRCRGSRRSTTRRSSATRRPTWSSLRVRRSGAGSTSRTSTATTSPRIRRTATSGSRRS